MNILAVMLQESGGETFPLFSLNTGVMIWTIIIFLGLVLVLGKWAWKPILGALEARERRIQEILDAAARDREEAEKALEEHRRQLAEGRQQAQQILAEGRQAAERVKQDMLEAARKQGGSFEVGIRKVVTAVLSSPDFLYRAITPAAQMFYGETAAVFKDDDVKVGDMVISSGMGGVFPKGLPLGEVTMVKKGEYGIFQTVEVRPTVAVGRLEEVLVLVPSNQ